MTAERTDEYWADLVREQCRLPAETEWVEFKHNQDNPKEIGEYISALANSAALLGRDNAYMIWGIADTIHDIIAPISVRLLRKLAMKSWKTGWRAFWNPRWIFGFIP